MGKRHSWWDKRAAIGVVLVLGTIACGSAASASGEARAAHAQNSVNDLKQDQRELKELNADVERFEKSMQTDMTQMEGQAPSLTPKAADQVSASIADLFKTYGEDYQRLAAQAQALHQRFVETLAASGSAYSASQAP